MGGSRLPWKSLIARIWTFTVAGASPPVAEDPAAAEPCPARSDSQAVSVADAATTEKKRVHARRDLAPRPKVPCMAPTVRRLRGEDVASRLRGTAGDYAKPPSSRF